MAHELAYGNGDAMANAKIVLKQIVWQESSQIHVGLEVGAAYDHVGREDRVVCVSAAQNVPSFRKESPEALISTAKDLHHHWR